MNRADHGTPPSPPPLPALCPLAAMLGEFTEDLALRCASPCCLLSTDPVLHQTLAVAFPRMGLTEGACLHVCMTRHYGPSLGGMGFEGGANAWWTRN